MDNPYDLRSLSDKELIARLKSLVEQDRRRLADLLACLAEMQRRKLYSDEGSPHLFEYCVRELKYSSGAAFRRVRAARAANLYPEVYSLIADGSLSLTAIAQIEPLLCPENKDQLLAQAQGKSTRDLERMVSALDPHADVADRMRRRPEAADLPLPSLAPRERLSSLAPERVQFSFTASERFRAEVERVRQLLRARFPEGRLEDVLPVPVEEYLERHDPDRRPPDPAVGPRRRLEARRRAVRFRRPRRPALPGPRAPRVRPREALRARRTLRRPGQRAAAVPGAQPARGAARLRRTLGTQPAGPNGPGVARRRLLS